MADNWENEDDDFDVDLFFKVNIDYPHPCGENGDISEVKAATSQSSVTSEVTPSQPAKKQRIEEQENQEVDNTSNFPMIKKNVTIQQPSSKLWINDFETVSSPSVSREPLTATSRLRHSSIGTLGVEPMTHREKARKADCVVALFFGEKPPSSALEDYNQSLPNWDVLLYPFSYQPPIYLQIDGILYFVNYVKLENKGRTTHFKFLGKPTEEAIKNKDLILELGAAIVYFRAHTEINLGGKLEWVLHKTLIDSSSLYLVCPRNDLVIHKK